MMVVLLAFGDSLTDAGGPPDADRAYIFAASEHFTTHAHELLTDYVVTQINARGGP